MRRIVLSVVACCAVIAILPASALAHRGHHKRHHARVHHRTFGQDWSQSGNSGTSTSSDQNAGTVVSFTGGVLTIALNNGQTVSGNVTGDTEIECQAPDTSSGMQSHETGDGGGDNQGDNDQGDDDQGQGDDNGDNASCSSADLTAGTVVHEARLTLSGAGATWDKVELVTTSASNSNNDDNDNDGD
jgi:hypothetical protein